MKTRFITTDLKVKMNLMTRLVNRNAAKTKIETIKTVSSIDNAIMSQLEANRSLRQAVECIISMLQDYRCPLTENLLMSQALDLCTHHVNYNSIDEAVISTNKAGHDIKISTLIKLLKINTNKAQ